MAIAWMYREDYRQAGFPMLPVIEPDGKRAGQQAVVYAAALLPISLVPTLAGATGWPYFWTALPLGAALLVLAARFARDRSETSARQLFFASITYLPLVLLAMVLAH
jgi:heme O synthase-like polyprenyltransferase